MSYIRWIPPSSASGHSLWRFFPIAVIAAMALVVAVNAGLVFAAVHSFPGKAGSEGFALSNHYDAVLNQAEREATLGWTLQAHTDDAGRPFLVATDRNGAPLRGMQVTALVSRPLGEPDERRVAFQETQAGRYVADTVLPAPGQWELTLSASLGSEAMAATRRVIVH
jgi:nitrogen fixation protein FixH